MPITLIGALIIPLGLIVATVYPRQLLPLMVFCSIFQASSISGLFGLTPYDYIGALVFLRFVVRQLYTLRLRIDYRARPLLWFWLWSVVSAGVLPVIFSGVPVVDPQLPLEQVLQGPTPLHISSSNFLQAIILTINVIALFEAWRSKISCWTAYKWGAIVATAIVYVQLVAGDKFPYALLNNSPSYGQAHLNSSIGLTRPSGTFVEPSVAGAFFCGIACFCLANYFEGKAPLWKCLIAVATLVLVGSGAGLAGFAIMLLAIAIRYRPWRDFNIELSYLKNWIKVAACMLVPLAAITPVAAHILQNTADKEGSFSFLVRTDADLVAFQAFIRTYGIGTGLGSDRSSSFLLTLAANLGVIGSLLFVWHLRRLNASWIIWGTLAVMLIGVPDISLPVLWAPMLLATRTLERQARQSLDLSVPATAAS